jgi:outer membrane protein assembly factor BamB
MNVNQHLIVAALLSLAAVGCAPASSKAPAGPSAINVEKVGFKTPESVMYLAKDDVYLVSNINVDGVPTKKDNNGFISRLSPDGTVQTLKWIAGGANDVTLNAPKGMAIVGNTLYVTDLDTVRKFDLTSGKALGEIPIPGTTFLNDLAAGKDGTVYVSDTGLVADEKGIGPSGTDAVYKISPADAVTTIAKDKALTLPNGLEVLANGKLQVVTFGSNEIYTLGEDGKRNDLQKMPAASLDGVITLSDGRLAISSWETSSLYALSPDGKVEVIAKDLPSPADLGYDAKRERLLVPIFQEDRVVIQPLK